MALMQSVIDGLLLGGIYACVSVGLSLSYGVMRIFNWANGELLMTATYLAIFFIRGTGCDPYISILITVPAMFLFGYLLQRYSINMIIMREKEREPLSVLLFTAGIAFVLKNLASFLFTTNAVSVKTKYQGQTWKLRDLVISQPKVIAFCVACLVILTIQMILSRTETGRGLRCASQDREVAQLMGMDIQKLYSLAMGIGFACVGVAGGVMSPMYSAAPDMGALFGTKSLIIVVLGGKGSVPGALIGGLLVGLIEVVAGMYLSGVYAQMIVFAVFVMVLMWKPNGILSKDRG